MLKLGAIGGASQALSWLLASESQGSLPRKTAKNCIYIFNYGGPSHIDTFDPKPDASVEIRGEFDTIQTAIPGLRFTEHVPRLAAIADRFALVRTVSHDVLEHRQGGYYSLTGHKPTRMAPPSPTDHPNPGAVVAHLQPNTNATPAHVTLPRKIHDNYIPVRGVTTSFLGPRYAPLQIHSDPNSNDYQVDVLRLSSGITPQRFDHRNKLLHQLDTSNIRSGTEDAWDYRTVRERAFALLAEPKVRRAFDIDAEPDSVRDRYGRTTYGQSLLQARRLIEHGTRLVTVLGGGPYPMDIWDTHQRNFKRLKGELLPPMDRALSALLLDLEERGLLEETLVVWLGEFGRTPRIGQTTISSMNKSDGRDHWPHCYSVLLAGGGIAPGQAYGASDRIAAYPASDPVRPDDIMATLYSALGIRTDTMLPGPQGRPIPLVEGHPIDELF